MAKLKKKNFDAFIHAVLEPLPDGVLIDTQYNSIARQTRRDAWYRAYTKTRYFEALLEYVRAAQSFYGQVEQSDILATIARMDDMALVIECRAAARAQILTPAYDQAGVAWKRTWLARLQAMSDSPTVYLPINREETEAAIAADEAFLAAHPVKRCRRSKVEG